MAKVLIVDDEPNIRRMLAGLLEAEGYGIDLAGDASSAVRAFETAEPDAVLLDLALPDTNGLELLESLRVRWPHVPVVMMSGRATLSDAVRATRIGAFHFLEKPLAPEALLVALEGAMELRRARDLARTLASERAEPLVGSSAAMRRVRELIAQIGPTTARVLVTGESGTGKELACTALHAASRRASGPFVRVNCAAIPRELVESEMFGHERGAFTGATEARLGKFELADGGTLLLDEVADLGLDAQAKLLRVIESGTIERLGAQHARSVDVRVFAATNRDLAGEIEAGRFRPDLFHRLDVLHVHMPPLRERPEEVPELVAHFMERLRTREGLAPPEMTPAAMSRLAGHSWPGNVRELANVCERLAILHAGRSVGPEHLDGWVPDPRAMGEPGVDLPLADRLDAYERDMIERSLREAGTVAEAAKRLRTDRPNLYRRMRRLGIER